MEIEGAIQKMETSFEEGEPVRYVLPIGAEHLEVNPLLGQSVRLEFVGAMSCIHCGRAIKKTFSQGHCYPCFRSLASCDSCIVKPELCHYDAGTCREPEWGEAHCLIPHTVYLANSSGVKVGITRGADPIGRWVDQGASQGLAIRRVQSRLESGEVEMAIKQHVADKTDWRKMLKGRPEPIDLPNIRDQLLEQHEATAPEKSLPGEPLLEDVPLDIQYPVLEYPEKVVARNLDKDPVVEGTLQGIKGQYLIFDVGVLNVRKYGGYHWKITIA